MDHTTTILSTKKLSLAQKETLYEDGFDVLMEDFVAISLIDFTPEKLYDNLIFTSQNAVQSALQHPQVAALKKLPAFCVGEKTKKLLEANGFKVTAEADYADDLAEIISLVYPNESFSFLCGNLRRAILPAILTENGITFNETEVYQTRLTPKKISQKLDGILFFSPSAVESYLKQNKIKDEACFCIGETTAEALYNHKIKKIIIAETPTIEAVIDAVIAY